ncbi:MAG TPA: alpha/beta hydrolase [Ktedonobacteraceae bacterium]|nr:alpha/beta hydrolase [Ktedonobacteraceae bacterium]
MKRVLFLAIVRKIWPYLLMVVLVGWILYPGFDAFVQLANPFNRSTPNMVTSHLPVHEVHFRAVDGVQLAGWLVIASPRAPTIILVHGSRGSRVDMLPWAQFLYDAGYNVLLYDNRGCGESEGWNTTLGAREPDDVLGAVHYLQQRSDLLLKQYGALGISLGAGVVLLAAAHEAALKAVVADSAWVDEHTVINGMSHVGLLPLLPYEPALVDHMIGAHLEDVSPLHAISLISPRAVLLIHSADDANRNTPLAGERQLYAQARAPKEQWIAPNGGHVGAIDAYYHEYTSHVLSFFATFLKAA